jgi:hypothetical protein
MHALIFVLLAYFPNDGGSFDECISTNRFRELAG